MKKLTFALAAILFISCAEKVKPTIYGKWNLAAIDEFNEAEQEWETALWMMGGSGELNYTSNDTVHVEFRPEEADSEPYSYSATYEYDPATSVAQHTRFKHSDPEEVGKTVQRRLVLKGDTLLMYADEFFFRLTWVRPKI